MHFCRINNIISHKTFIKPAQAQDSQESRWTKCRIHAQAQDSQESQESQDFEELSGKTLTKNLGILGNLGPVHESCTLFIGILGNLGPVQVLWAFKDGERLTKPAQAQDSPESRWTKCRIDAQAQDSQESQDFFGTLSGSCLIVPQNLGILGNLGPVHESCTLFIGILGNLGPVQVLWLQRWRRFTKPAWAPRFPRILMNKVQDSCTGPRFPRIPRFFGRLSGSCLIVPQNLGILGNLGPVQHAWILHFVHQESWESWACAGFVPFSNF